MRGFCVVFQAREYWRAVGLVGLATIARFGLRLADADGLPFVTFFPAILLAAMWGGIGPGTLASLLSLLIGWLVFMHPPWSFALSSPGSVLSLVAFAASAGMLVWIADRYRREHVSRQILMQELQHRSRNASAVVQAIVNQSLQGDPAAAQRINGRLSALIGTDQALTETSAHSLPIRQILTAELRPYGPERVSLDGADVRCNSALSRTLALVTHELATNAVKYGALSNGDGRVAVAWRMEPDETIVLTWRERDGPAVVPPERVGFGSQLVNVLLKSHDGEVTMNYEPSGLVCVVRFRCEPTTVPLSRRRRSEAQSLITRSIASRFDRLRRK